MHIKSHYVKYHVDGIYIFKKKFLKLGRETSNLGKILIQQKCT